MEIYIGADYRGYAAKEALKRILEAQGHDVADMGVYRQDEGDYNEPAREVAREVRESPGARGILICDSGHGVTMQANRYKGVRATRCENKESAKFAREHDDANVLCVAAHSTDTGEMAKIAEVFLSTPFTPVERRVRRINKLDEEGA